MVHITTGILKNRFRVFMHVICIDMYDMYDRYDRYDRYDMFDRYDTV